ncbi:MAG: CAP domain-containing protein [Enhygromyxa sp.]
MGRRTFPRVWIALTSAALLSGCYEGIDVEDWYGAEGLDGFDSFADETGDEGQGSSGDSSGGDGDGDPSTGDDDGDGDPTTTGDGDGDPTTGDGDGDPTTGDGDGDPTTGDGDGDPTTGDGDGDPDVPSNAYCDPVSNWDPAWVDFELQVLQLVNQARAQGGNCGTQGNFNPSGPLSIDPALTCAARVHSKDMADNNYFSHTNLQGQGPGYRIGQAGYSGSGWGENIAAGYSTPQQVIDGWLDSDGHCANMLNPGFKDIGIGYAYGGGSQYGHYWTQNFGGG